MLKLNDAEVHEKLGDVPEWTEINGEIQRTYQFETFVDAIAFVNKVAEYAERAQHHPDILIRYSKVTLTVSTHDAGGITQNDFDLAGEADGFAGV